MEEITNQVEIQKKCCESYRAQYTPIDEEQMVVISEEKIAGHPPVHSLPKHISHPL